MMKKCSFGSFKCLVINEYLLSRKDISMGLKSFIFLAIIPIMATLSFKYGNLALLKDTSQGWEMADEIYSMCRLFPAIGCAFWIVITDTKAGAKFELYKKFRLSTPVGWFGYALAKSTAMIILFIVSIVVYMAYLGLWCSINEIKFDMSYMAEFWVMQLMMIFIQTMIKFFYHLTGSIDKASMLMLAVVALVMVILLLIPNLKNPGENPIAKLLGTKNGIRGFLADNSNIWIILIIGVIVLDFVLMCVSYKRRIK